MNLSAEDVAALPEDEFKDLVKLVLSRLRRGKRQGIWISAFMSIGPGETTLVRGRRVNAGLVRSKQIARERLNAPDANWRCKSTNHGVRIVRLR